MRVIDVTPRPAALSALIRFLQSPIMSILGIIFTVLETRDRAWVPSPTGAGIGMLVPAAVIIVMFVGSVADRIWRQTDRRSHELYMTPLASGLIAGEAIVAVIIPLLVVMGLVHP